MLTSDNIETEIKQDGLILVKFTSESCKECKKMDIVLDKIEYPVYTVDIDREPDLQEEYEIERVPTLIIFLNGQNMETIVGFKTKTTLNAIINSFI